MNNLALAADGAWKVLVASLILGAGLPVDLRPRCPRAGLTRPAPGHRRRSTRSGTRSATCCSSCACSWSCSAWPLGITIIVASGFGKAVSFEHIYPTIVSK